MEHRFGNRRAIRAKVVLHPHAGIPVRAQICDVSISGMFVEITSGVFSANSMLGVELTLPGASGLRTYRWQAMVIRRTESGLGLMFDRLRPPAITRLLANIDAGLPPGATAPTLAESLVTPRPAAGKTQAPL